MIERKISRSNFSYMGQCNDYFHIELRSSKFNIYWKNTKLPSPWTSKTPKRYKQNTINGDLHRSKRISSNFDEEIPLIKEKFMKADYPLRFINSVVNEFQKGKEYGD